ncbi:unnamed protein product [Effrenium voratum]|uniref:Sugar phosphate transporter domain-containing protein n=1 Tax=Effrenium voratum TaxID=2562239 RepID=A0AA36HK48_9DINO|nr:unnamed protein product [Effrenium voratum]CAJ1459106.1 unnamed protein product [Effrenium voratum]
MPGATAPARAAAPAVTAVPNAAASVLQAVVIGGTYILTSSALTCFNKYLMQGRFCHVVHLTAIHTAVTFILSLCFYMVAPQFYPSMAGAKEQFRLTLRWIAPLGLLFAVSFFSLNQAYQHSSAAFLQLCKQGNVALLFFMSCACGRQVFSWSKVSVLSIVLSGCSACVSGEMHFALVGVVLQVTAQLAECSKNLLAEIVLSGAGLKMDALSFVLFQAPFCLLFLLLGAWHSWTPAVLEDFKAQWHLLLANASLAFVLNVLIAVALKRLSALSFVMMGVLKDAAAVSLAWAAFGDPVSLSQQTGFLVTVVGIGMWGRLKMQEAQEPEKLPLARGKVRGVRWP